MNDKIMLKLRKYSISKITRKLAGAVEGVITTKTYPFSKGRDNWIRNAPVQCNMYRRRTEQNTLKL